MEVRPRARSATRSSTTRFRPRIRRYRAITVRTTDENGNLAPWYHTHEDLPERVDPDALARATEFVTSLARLLDRDTGRRV